LRTLSLNNIACRKECASKLKKNMVRNRPPRRRDGLNLGRMYLFAAAKIEHIVG
jgi:hypothetical protein